MMFPQGSELSPLKMRAFSQNDHMFTCSHGHDRLKNFLAHVNRQGKCREGVRLIGAVRNPPLRMPPLSILSGDSGPKGYLLHAIEKCTNPHTCRGVCACRSTPCAVMQVPMDACLVHSQRCQRCLQSSHTCWGQRILAAQDPER